MLPDGEHLAVFQAPGRETARVPFLLEADRRARCNAWLPLIGAGPDEFVLAHGWTPDQTEPFWILDREVTVAEYFEFLNDPAVRAEIDASEAPIRVPRLGGVGYVGEDGVGRLIPDPEWLPEWPILGVSWDDAMAYAAWRTERAHAAGEPFTFSLPTGVDQQAAWGQVRQKVFPFGWTFRPAWVSSNYSTPKPAPERVLSYPVDESVLGVFDLAGSVSEWMDEWWVEEKGHRRLYGGSWGHGGKIFHEMFGWSGYNGMSPLSTSGTLGFRLVVRPERAAF